MRHLITNKLTALTAVATLFAISTCAVAQSSDALINKLVQKGLLTTQEAADLRKEAQDEFNNNFKNGFNSAYRTQTGMPEWVNKMKFSGDFRARYDRIWQDTSPLPSSDRDRFRYRLRFGVTIGLADNFEVGLRLGSGEVGSSTPSLGASPFSANTTMNNDGSRKFIFVDLAYAKWKPSDHFFAEVGKMNDEFWFTDMTIDPDYNPEGAQERLSIPVGQKHTIGLTSGQFVIAENFNSSVLATNDDVYLLINQADWQAKWTDKLSSRLAVGMINFINQSAMSPAMESFINQNGSPAVASLGVSGVQEFTPIIIRGEVTYNLDSFPVYHGAFPITLGVEYAQNLCARGLVSSTDAEAWNVGIGLGSAKTKGNWQLSYNYKDIGTAAVWHGLNDDDFGYGGKGGTNVRGHQVVFAYHVAAPLTVNLRYMHTERIIPLASAGDLPGSSAEQDRLFFDLLWSF